MRTGEWHGASAGLGDDRLPPRLRGRVSRIGVAYARATDPFRAVFGCDTVVAKSLRARVTAVRESDAFTLSSRAERLHAFVLWLSSVTEAIETESNDASSLRVQLGVIMVEAEQLACVVGLQVVAA